MTNFSGSAGSRKRSSSFSSASLSRMCSFHSGGSCCAPRHHDGAGVGADQLVHHLLVEHAALAVEHHDLRLEAVRLHLGLEVLHDVLHHGPHALRVLHQHGHLGGALGEVVAVLLAQAAGDLLVGFVNRGLVDLQLHLRRLEMQRQRGLVADGLLERVAAHVALARPRPRRRPRRCCGRRG